MYNDIQYCKIQKNNYNTVEYCTIQYNTVQCRTIYNYTLHYSNVSIALNTTFYNYALNSILHYIIKYCTVLYNEVPYYTVVCLSPLH